MLIPKLTYKLVPMHVALSTTPMYVALSTTPMQVRPYICDPTYGTLDTSPNSIAGCHQHLRVLAPSGREASLASLAFTNSHIPDLHGVRWQPGLRPPGKLGNSLSGQIFLMVVLRHSAATRWYYAVCSCHTLLLCGSVRLLGAVVPCGAASRCCTTVLLHGATMRCGAAARCCYRTRL